MISTDCDFNTFIEAIKDKDDMEIIYLAEQEASTAERFAFRSKSNPKEKQKYSKKYSAILKDYIQYLKYTTKFKLPEGPKYQLFLQRHYQ